jgi:hypothetical protein
LAARSGFRRVNGKTCGQAGRSSARRRFRYSQSCGARRCLPAWVIRLHLPRGTTPENITLNGEAVIGQLIAPAAEVVAMPFMGTGASPAPEAGPVLEVSVPSVSTSQSIWLAVEL